MSQETNTYPDLRVPGLSFTVSGTSIMDTETGRMTAIFDVDGGKGRVTVEFDEDHDITLRTDQLCQHLYSALQAQTAALLRDTLTHIKFNDIVKDFEVE